MRWGESEKKTFTTHVFMVDEQVSKKETQALRFL